MRVELILNIKNSSWFCFDKIQSIFVNSREKGKGLIIDQ